MPLGAVFWHTPHDLQNLVTSRWVPSHKKSLMILFLVFLIPRCPLITDSCATSMLTKCFGTITWRICSPLFALGCLYSRYHTPFLSSNVTSCRPFSSAFWFRLVICAAMCLPIANATLAFCRHPSIPSECSSPMGCSGRSFRSRPGYS